VPSPSLPPPLPPPPNVTPQSAPFIYSHAATCAQSAPPPLPHRPLAAAVAISAQYDPICYVGDEMNK
jgi:hypothetical protein